MDLHACWDWLSASCFIVSIHPEGCRFLQGPVGGVNKIVRRGDAHGKGATPWNIRSFTWLRPCCHFQLYLKNVFLRCPVEGVKYTELLLSRWVHLSFVEEIEFFWHLFSLCPKPSPIFSLVLKKAKNKKPSLSFYEVKHTIIYQPILSPATHPILQRERYFSRLWGYSNE